MLYVVYTVLFQWSNLKERIEEGGMETKLRGIRNHFLYRETETTGVVMESRLEQVTQQNSKAFCQCVRLTGRQACDR